MLDDGEQETDAALNALLTEPPLQQKEQQTQSAPSITNLHNDPKAESANQDVKENPEQSTHAKQQGKPSEPLPETSAAELSLFQTEVSGSAQAKTKPVIEAFTEDEALESLDGPLAKETQVKPDVTQKDKVETVPEAKSKAVEATEPINTSEKSELKESKETSQQQDKKLASSKAKPEELEDIIPPDSATFFEELPANFWESDAESDPPPASRSPKPDYEETQTSTQTSAIQANRGPQASKNAKPNGIPAEVEKDPKFAILQSLFPGMISDWQDAKTNDESDLTDVSSPDAIDLADSLEDGTRVS